MLYNVFIYVDDEMKALIHENLGYSGGRYYSTIFCAVDII